MTVQQADSGHPGLPLGAAPMAYVLWQNHLKQNPRDPSWPNRDRFVLSAGHGGMLHYCLLDRYGASAPGEVAMTKLGFSARNVAKRAKALLKRRT